MNPTSINVRMQSKVLEINFGEIIFSLPFELLRVYSPSAEVRGHGPGQEILQTEKRNVSITELQPVGHYAIQPFFTDGHNTGIYTWEYLHWLGVNQTRLWQEYLNKLQAAGFSGDAGRNAAQMINDRNIN
ncbi:MAG: hypothetical protein K0R08_594 [Solimicrobium sp.]|jgi:DUF971 family protein|nr:hypothetical protein [Solimicrobium sp.]